MPQIAVVDVKQLDLISNVSMEGGKRKTSYDAGLYTARMQFIVCANTVTVVFTFSYKTNQTVVLLYHQGNYYIPLLFIIGNADIVKFYLFFLLVHFVILKCHNCPHC